MELLSAFSVVILGLRYIFFKVSFQISFIFGFQFQRNYLVKGNLHLRSGAMEKNLEDLLYFSDGRQKDVEFPKDYMQGEK